MCVHMSVYLHLTRIVIRLHPYSVLLSDMLPSAFAEDVACHTKQELEDGWCQQ